MKTLPSTNEGLGIGGTVVSTGQMQEENIADEQWSVCSICTEENAMECFSAKRYQYSALSPEDLAVVKLPGSPFPKQDAGEKNPKNIFPTRSCNNNYKNC